MYDRFASAGLGGGGVQDGSVVRRGAAMPGTPYTGVRVEYRSPQTGHIRTEWAGELYGAWDTDRDPASEMLANIQASGDGYLPYRAVLSSPNPNLPGTWDERDVILLNGGTQEIAMRVYSRKQQEN